MGDNPQAEQAGVRAEVVIPKASLSPGGLSVQREMTLALMDSISLGDLATEAVARLEERVRDRMAAALAAQNDRRAAVGLPPLVVADEVVPPPPENPVPPAEHMAPVEQPNTPASPYRGNRRTSTREARA